MSEKILTLDTQAREIEVENGVDRDDRRSLATALNRALASTYALYAKTHVYHWNITGPLFYSVHKLTDEQYRGLAEAIDVIAERVRAIGFSAEGGLKTFLDNSVIGDVEHSVIPASDMIRELASDHQTLARDLREAVAEAEEADDVFTADLLTARIGAHEEAAWMLNALLVQ